MLPRPVNGYERPDIGDLKLVRIFRPAEFEPTKNYRQATPANMKGNWTLIECRNGVKKDFPEAESEEDARNWVYEFE